jgi:fatty acid synthase subunit alpha
VTSRWRLGRGGIGHNEHSDDRFENGSPYVSWVESKSGEPLDEKDAKSKFEKDIFAHAGMKSISKELIASA